MHILLIEASLTGHHAIYLERIALTYFNAGYSVTIALPKSICGGQTLRSQLNSYTTIQWMDYDINFDLNPSGIIGLLRREYSVRKSFQLIFKKVRTASTVDFVFVPYFDYCLYAVGLMGSPFGTTMFGGICMRPAFHYQECGVIAPITKLDWIKRCLFVRLLRGKYVRKIFSIDQLLVEYTKQHISTARDKIEYLPDPVDKPVEVNNAKIRARYGTPIDSKIILVYGVLDERKGICLLLDTLETESELDEWQVWLIGIQSPSIEELLAGNRWTKLMKHRRIQVRNEFVTTEIEQQVFSACDVVWIAYQTHYGMSGVMVHAGLHGRCIIACQTGLIGWYACKMSLGMVISNTTLSVKSCLTTLRDGAVRDMYGANGKKAFGQHTWLNFESQLQRLC